MAFFDKYKARLAWDSLTGQIEAKARHLAQSIDWSAHRPGKRTVLCLDRSQFSKDIDELRDRTHYNWVTTRAAALKRCQEAWVAPGDRNQTYFTGYLEGRCQHLKEPLRRFGLAFLKEAQKRHPISAVMAGNTDYWQDDAIKLACQTLGIPFLILCRENYITSLDFNNVTGRMADAGFKFGGKGVAVFSDRTRITLEATNAFPKDSIWLTGAPRYDRWREVVAPPKSQRRFIVLLSYAHPLYLAPQNFAEVARRFCELAREAPAGIEYLIKVKKPSDIDVATEALPDVRNYPVKLIWEEPIYETFPQALAVIGFNTMATLEGFLCDVPVIVPCWADAVRTSDEALMSHANPDDAAVAYFPRSADELAALLKQAERGELPARGTIEMQQARFHHHIARTGAESSSAIVERFVDHYVDEAERAAKKVG
ncbi:MAG: hypothetical protein HYU58_00845 [Proteobacteria bacterium]|nr:hypothetical protein [Pseudomonadota bacterium]